MSTKINYILDPVNDEKLLPHQYYNLHKFVTIPILPNDKRPFIKEWNKTTHTIHPSDINQNIGILTGRINNITVLDIDMNDDGIKHFKLISKQYKEIKTPIVKSPNGGIHLFFNYNNKIPNFNRILVNNNKIGWDIKSNNSMVIAPPSIVNNKKYKWIKNYSLDDINIINMPKWLEKYILDHLKPSTLKKC